MREFYSAFATKTCANLLAVSAGLMLVLSSPAGASVQYGNCMKPSQPSLPTIIDTQEQVDTLRVLVTTYLQDSGGYSKCLIQYAIDNQASMSTDDKTAMKAEYQSEETTRQSFSTQWNNLYEAYLQKTRDEECAPAADVELFEKERPAHCGN